MQTIIKKTRTYKQVEEDVEYYEVSFNGKSYETKTKATAEAWQLAIDKGLKITHYDLGGMIFLPADISLYSIHSFIEDAFPRYKIEAPYIGGYALDRVLIVFYNDDGRYHITELFEMEEELKDRLKLIQEIKKDLPECLIPPEYL